MTGFEILRSVRFSLNYYNLLMESKKLSHILMFKLICCGVILLFVLGGVGLLSGFTTGSIIVILLSLAILAYAGYLYARRRR
jgi:uncharacterized membrane protein